MTFRKDLEVRERTLKLAEEKKERSLIAPGPFQPWKLFLAICIEEKISGSRVYTNTCKACMHAQIFTSVERKLP